ncbi:MAG: hypothetical protein IKO43_04960, partial [Kiritimatiellae bacterium]|nr:hypothetical protein [Kiritimatiellia bacterium]
ENTVAHLPTLCGTVADSVFWSENFAGYTPSEFHQDGSDNPLSKFDIVNTMNPYNMVSLHDEEANLRRKLYRVSLSAYAGGGNIPDGQSVTNNATYRKYLYDTRMAFNGVTDLVPLGSAFAKRLTESWDGEGPEDAWTRTTDGNSREGDLADNGIPQWAIDAGYTTEEDYLVALADGLLPDGAKDITYTRDYYFNELAKKHFYDDENGNEIPDWWERYFGIYDCDKNGDEDNDGLSNYQEFLISFGDYSVTTTTDGWSIISKIARNVGMPFLSPVDAHSTDEAVVDYFLKPDFDQMTDSRLTKNTYLGEMVTDHDKMEMWWELKNNVNYSNAFVYDPYLDNDGDGWSNFAESRAYSWYGGYIADIIDRYFSSNAEYHDISYPVPTIGVTITYNGIQNISANQLVVRTKSSSSSRVDAKFVVPVSTLNTDTYNSGSRFLGSYIGDANVHGYLHPGRLMPSADLIIYRRIVNDANIYIWRAYYTRGDYPYTTAWWTHSGNYQEYHAAINRYGVDNVQLVSVAPSEIEFARAYADSEGRVGKIVVEGTNSTGSVQIELGHVDYQTGEYTFNPSLATGLGSISEEDLNGCVFRMVYSYRIGDEWPQTFWLSDTSIATGYGRVKEGKNTVEAFMDLNGNGTYDIGEPYGALRDVEIGWHKTGEPLVIELTDDSTIVKRTAIATETSSNTNEAETVTEGLTTSIVVRRSAVNGDTSIGRRLSSSTIVLDDRAYVTEADILGSATSEGLDLDWKWLSVDAANKLGNAADVRNATYEILLQGEESPIATFSRTFSSSRGKAQILAPVTSAPVYSARPTVTFACDDETMTAYCLQIATSASEGDVIWSSGTKRLPGRTPYSTDKRAVYAVTPEIYVDTFATTNGTPVFADGGKYYARVALMNSKFNNTDDENCWSAWAEFQMDVANALQNPDTQTGYGNVAAAVRYSGAGAVTDLSGVSNVVVEAYNTADFTGAPVARTRLASIEGIDSASDVTTTNAVMSGIAPGTVYLMAYIDSNNNGKRDAWESWGYANRIGEDTKFLYTPKSVEVTDANYMYQSATIYIEDADLNQNEIPDILEGPVSQSEEDDPALVDSDGDGLMDVDETDYYGTNPYDADTDDDGIPDGYEVATGSDPLTADADTAGKGDYMAYAEVEAYVFETNGVAYVLNVDKGLAYETAAIGGANGTLVATSLVDGFSLADIAGTVTNAFSKRSVVLVHSAVNDWFGYDSTTARDPATLDVSLDGESTNDVSTVLGPNTVPFSAFWKYFTTEFYLPAHGVELDEPMTIASLDYEANGLPDGWELYVKYAAGSDPDKTDDEYRDDLEDGTDPTAEDTDGDGIPDNEEREIGTDPRTPDADTALEGDVMAYAELKRPVVTFEGMCGEGVREVVIMEGTVPSVGQIVNAAAAANLTMREAYVYGTQSNYVWGVGMEFTVADGEVWRVLEVRSSETVALVHSQVYDAYGFNPRTANATVSSNEWASVNSKAFTALDKTLVTRYFQAIGMTAEADDWKKYALKADTVDSNGDGIADGWELYVMFGPSGTDSAAGTSPADAKISPWMSAAEANNPGYTPDGGGLAVVDEYDEGNSPTDPWSVYSLDSTIDDRYLKLFHLKGDDAGFDYDGDGLSNYAEYLISEVFHFADVDPENPTSGDGTLDYFKKFGELYLGELFSDHDQTGDDWEAKYEAGDIDGVDYAARGIFNPSLDLDRDGWSNYAEYRAGTSPARQMSTGIDDYTLIEHPVPVVEMEIVYNGTADIEGRT